MLTFAQVATFLIRQVTTFLTWQATTFLIWQVTTFLIWQVTTFLIWQALTSAEINTTATGTPFGHTGPLAYAFLALLGLIGYVHMVRYCSPTCAI